MQHTREGVIVSAQVSREQRQELERRAAAGDRSLSSEIRRALREYLAREQESRDEGTR
jgi:hypothetical protein